MPAGPTYEPIATATLGSDGFFTFSSIPSTYTDLRVILVGAGSGGTQNVRIELNGDVGGNYSLTSIYGTGSTASMTATRVSGQTRFASGIFDFPDNSVGTGTLQLDFLNYSGNTVKTILWQSSSLTTSGATNYVWRANGSWFSTNAINQIYIYGSRNYVAGSSATIYGITRA